jgi:hypothetical protein
MRKKDAQNYIRRLEPILCKAATARDPLGVVKLWMERERGVAAPDESYCPDGPRFRFSKTIRLCDETVNRGQRGQR